MEGSDGPLVVIRKDWFKAKASNRVLGFIMAIVLLIVFIVYLHISDTPDAWFHTGALVLFIIAALMGIWTNMRMATASTFELYMDKAVQSDDWRGRTVTVPLDDEAATSGHEDDARDRHDH